MKDFVDYLSSRGIAFDVSPLAGTPLDEIVAICDVRLPTDPPLTSSCEDGSKVIMADVRQYIVDRDIRYLDVTLPIEGPAPCP